MTPRENGQDGNVDRREVLQALTVSVAAYGVAPSAIARWYSNVERGQYQYVFFTGPELSTMRTLADMVIPADNRSGSATDAGTVEYADFILSVSGEDVQDEWRRSFAWLDQQCGERFRTPSFAQCTVGQRATVLNAIAWPDSAAPEYADAARWFNRARDLIGSGFFSSAMGVRDLDFRGGVFNPGWQGAPQAALDQLGVSYDDWDQKYGRPRAR